MNNNKKDQHSPWMSQGYLMLHSPYYPKSSEIPTWNYLSWSHGSMASILWKRSQRLIIWKNKRKKQRWDGFLLMAEWSCESLIFLPKPFVIWSSCSRLPSCHCPQTPGIIIMSNSSLHLEFPPHISACQIFFRITQHTHHSFKWAHTVTWSLPRLSQMGRAFFLLGVCGAVCAQPLEPPSFVGCDGVLHLPRVPDKIHGA